MKTPLIVTTAVARAVLAIVLTLGASSMSVAATFVYVSDAEDGTIDSYVMDTKTGALTSIGKTEAGKTVMPMAVSPNKKISLCGGPLAAHARADLCDRRKNRCANAESECATAGQHALCLDRSQRPLPLHCFVRR